MTALRPSGFPSPRCALRGTYVGRQAGGAGWKTRAAAIVSLLIFAAACWRFWDFFVVTMAMVGIGFSLATAWVLWAVHKEFGRK